MVPDGLDQLWVADITHIRLQAEYAYLAIMFDAFSRRVVGWALETHLEARLAVAALSLALAARQPPPGNLIHHSDRGIQGGSNRSSQHRLCSLTTATRQAPLPAFSNPGFFSAGH
ncbi:DDE-type integrase/transposase/recombinase [Bradyrhizobium sp. USDA 3311]